MAVTWAMTTAPGEDPRAGLMRIVDKLVADLVTSQGEASIESLLASHSLIVTVAELPKAARRIVLDRAPTPDCRADLGFTRERLRAALLDPCAR